MDSKENMCSCLVFFFLKNHIKYQSFVHNYNYVREFSPRNLPGPCQFEKGSSGGTNTSACSTLLFNKQRTVIYCLK